MPRRWHDRAALAATALLTLLATAPVALLATAPVALLATTPAARADEGTAAALAAQQPGFPSVRAPVSNTDPVRAPGTIGIGSLDTAARLRVDTARTDPSHQCATTLATAGVPQLVLAASTTRRFVALQNQSAGHVAFSFTSATPAVGTDWQLWPGGYYSTPAGYSDGAGLYAVADTAGAVLSCEWR